MKQAMPQRMGFWSTILLLLILGQTAWSATELARIPVVITYTSALTNLASTTLARTGNSGDACSTQGYANCGEDYTGAVPGCSFGPDSTLRFTGSPLPILGPSGQTYHLSVANNASSLNTLLCPSGSTACPVCLCLGAGNVANATNSIAGSGIIVPSCSAGQLQSFTLEHTNGSTATTLILTFP